MEIFLVYMGKNFKVVVSRSFDKITVQSDTYLESSYENINYTRAYIRVNEFDDKSDRDKFLQLLRVKVHFQCDIHKLLLIISRQKNTVVIGNSSIFVVV